MADVEAAKRPVTKLAGPYGHPFHPALVTVPIGAWVASLVTPQFRPGDRVRLVGQRWSRYVRSIEPVPGPQTVAGLARSSG